MSLHASSPTQPASPNPEEARQRQRILQLLQRNPLQVADELIAARRSCHDAEQAATKLEELVQKLVEQNANLVHLESLRETATGEVRAVCRMGPQLQELGVHPDVPVDALRRLLPWEYACVHEGVVIGVWQDDDSLFTTQLGEVVTFEGYVQPDGPQVRVSQPGREEAIVTLAASLRDAALARGTKLVLQRDDPRWAIKALPAQQSESRFEVPLDRLNKRLEDLAGLDELGTQFLEDILLRVAFPEIRDMFDLSPLRGALLISYMPGMGKTAFCEALTVSLQEIGFEHGFDVVLYHVKPNELTSLWHGEDSRIVREDLFGAIRAREAVPRNRPLIQLLVLDEVDSLKKRTGAENMLGSAHSDALEAVLVELQGLGTAAADGSGPPAHLVCIGLTNRPDRLDGALKRPGRLGDLVCVMPAITRESAADIMAIYARKASLRWSCDGRSIGALESDEVAERFLCPAVGQVFPLVVAHYFTDTQRKFEITAGQILAGVHYEDAMNRAKRRAGLRMLHEHGVPAICPDDVLDALLDVALSTARQMEADPGMLKHQLQIGPPVTRVSAVPRSELELHRYLKVHSA